MEYIIIFNRLSGISIVSLLLPPMVHLEKKSVKEGKSHFRSQTMIFLIRDKDSNILSRKIFNIYGSILL